MQTPSSEELLIVLQEYPQGVSLPRLSKRLGLRASVVLRALAMMGDGFGSHRGPGWVRVEQTDGIWNVSMTPLGRQAAQNTPR